MKECYIQLNQDNIVEGILEIEEENASIDLIEIEQYDRKLLNKEYNFLNKTFVQKENSYLPETLENIIGPSQSDRIELEIENLKTQQNEILEKLNMLLNIQGDV